MPRPADPAKEQRWRRLLRLFGHSDLTVRDFCARHRLALPSFYAWRSEIARRDRRRTAADTDLPGAQAGACAALATAAPAFVEVALAAAATPTAIDVILPSGRRLRVTPGFDADLLCQLLRLLEGPAC